LVELKEKRLRKSLSEAKNEWQGQKDSNPRHAVLEALKHIFTRVYLVLFYVIWLKKCNKTLILLLFLETHLYYAAFFLQKC